jgi:hypothetical protein
MKRILGISRPRSRSRIVRVPNSTPFGKLMRDRAGHADSRCATAVISLLVTVWPHESSWRRYAVAGEFGTPSLPARGRCGLFGTALRHWLSTGEFC